MSTSMNLTYDQLMRMLDDSSLVVKRRRIEDETKIPAQGTTTAKVIEQNNDETDTEVDAEAESTTSILDFDSLSVVFSYLDIRGRLAVGAVCRRWRLVCEGIWKRVKVLNLREPSFSKLVKYRNEDKIPVIIRLCPNVTEIAVDFMKDVGISAAIAESCPRLERLTVFHYFCSPLEGNLEGLSRIPLKCPHLKAFDFKIRTCSSFRRSYWTFLNQFVRNVQELEEIAIDGDVREKNSWLASLSKPLKSLHISNYEFSGEDVLNYVEIYGDHLRHLTMKPITSALSNRRLKKILSMTPNLTQLNLIGVNFELPVEGEDDSFREFAQLKYLTRLSLECNIIIATSSFLENVVKGCPELSHLDLSGAFNFESLPCVLPSLADLDNLVSLNLSMVTCLSEVLPSLTTCLMRLKELIAVETYLDDKGCFTILKNGIALEYLDISGNARVTDLSLDYASEIYIDNPSRPKLFIRAFGCYLMSIRSADPHVADRLRFHIRPWIDDDIPCSGGFSAEAR